MLLRPPIEVWHAGDPASVALFHALVDGLPEADVRPRGGHPKAVVVVVLLCSPALKRTELGGGDPTLAADLARLFSADDDRRDDPVVAMLTEGEWSEVAPDDLREAEPYLPHELPALLDTLRALVSPAEA